MEPEIHQTYIEKFTLKDGRDFLLYRPRINHTIDGRKASGYIASDEGDPTQWSTAIDMSLVDRHVAMGWSRKEAKLVDCPDYPLLSLS